MSNRLKLQTLLNGLLNIPIHYQPPGNLTLTHPCVIYRFDGQKAFRAQNVKYLNFGRYLVTLITPDIDSPLQNLLLEHPKFTFLRSYQSGNLHHSVFSISI